LRREGGRGPDSTRPGSANHLWRGRRPISEKKQTEEERRKKAAARKIKKVDCAGAKRQAPATGNPESTTKGTPQALQDQKGTVFEKIQKKEGVRRKKKLPCRRTEGAKKDLNPSTAAYKNGRRQGETDTGGAAQRKK